ncbi:MAG TPA: hypothetical protein VG960_11295 [Caulobacteraceae bacterium]|nr:hypothetical protein [Caulobacteraceae bacterium]
MRPLKLFYSWQMDQPSKLCRDFIGRALEVARDHLATEGIALEIDSDTKDVPGTPAISDTILAKIRDCDLFLADMTFVAVAGDKLIPNPNVMGEYGYALRDKGTRRILLAMNSAFGPPEKLPFDLHHLRHPAQFKVDGDTPDGARRQAREAFGAQLADHILAAAKDVFAEAGVRERSQRDLLQGNWWQAVQARSLNDRPILVSGPSAVVHIVPAGSPDSPDLDPRVVKNHRRLLRLQDGATEGASGRQWWAHGPTRRINDRPNPEGHWYGRLLQPGIIEFEQTVGERIDDDPTILIRGTRLEAEIVNMADQGLALAEGLGLASPFGVGVVLYGLEDVELASRYRSGRFRMPSLDLPLSVSLPGVAQAGASMRSAFDQLWMSAGFADGSPSFSGATWAGYDA